MTIQILHYDFLGPIKLSEWGPPMDEVVYAILSRINDTFSILYVDHSDKTTEIDFFTKSDKFKCWLAHAGSDTNLYLSIHLMPHSDESEREKIVQRAINRYKPVCNIED